MCTTASVIANGSVTPGPENHVKLTATGEPKDVVIAVLGVDAEAIDAPFHEALAEKPVASVWNARAGRSNGASAAPSGSRAASARRAKAPTTNALPRIRPEPNPVRKYGA